MNRNIYLHEGNAEEILPDVISLMKSKVAFESRKQAFEECTKFWGEHIQTIIKEPISAEEKLALIQKMFGK